MLLGAVPPKCASFGASLDCAVKVRMMVVGRLYLAYLPAKRGNSLIGYMHAWELNCFAAAEELSMFCFCDDSYDRIPVKICCVDAAKNFWNRNSEFVSVPKVIGSSTRVGRNTSVRK